MHPVRTWNQMFRVDRRSTRSKPYYLPEHYRFVCYRSNKNREQHHHDKKCKSDVRLAPRLRLAETFHSWAFAWIALWVDTATVCELLVKNGNFNLEHFFFVKPSVSTEHNKEEDLTKLRQQGQRKRQQQGHCHVVQFSTSSRRRMPTYSSIRKSWMRLLSSWI